MIRGSCHCGGVTLSVAYPPLWVGSCNCSLCRRLGTLWAYYPKGDVRVEGVTVGYVQGDRTLSTHHCPTCGCISHWWPLLPDVDRVGVNARLLDAFDPADVEVRLLDNAG
ncbi:MAG: GFA family protein [Sphingomonadales bacterium]